MHLLSSQDYDEETGRKLIYQEVYEYGRQKGLSIEGCLSLSDDIYNHMFKLDILQKYLDDPSVNEIMINGYQEIHIERRGQITRTKDAFESEEVYLSVIQTIVSNVNRRVNMSQPIVDARLNDGSRIHVVLKPVALNGPIVTIRKFTNHAYSLVELMDRQAISREVFDFLIDLVKYKYNLFISGGTSSGKTTFLNALAHYIPSHERVITIEDSAELALDQVKNLVKLETRSPNSQGECAIDMAALIKASLRMRPDRIVVGEVRGVEAIDMIHAMNTGHDGSLSTGHANSSKDMLRRLEIMILKGLDLPSLALERLIGSSIDVVIHLERGLEGHRYIREIIEVLDCETGYEVNVLFQMEDGCLRLKNPLIQKEKYDKYKGQTL